ncbi:neurofilament heavy polypeptide-like isoform X5 [Lethenteron reissneri]|uniref:neurofilament heavy polypeptide-like isoform X5 n=1 Tax=Lethenteron reissneri TaxID=7753 RepID=UPI002AB63798|nr:neurofilament heavy polypeptide-like isoform X5 [Lethenteron reissneri]
MGNTESAAEDMVFEGPGAPDKDLDGTIKLKSYVQRSSLTDSELPPLNGTHDAQVGSGSGGDGGGAKKGKVLSDDDNGSVFVDPSTEEGKKLLHRTQALAAQVLDDGSGKAGGKLPGSEPGVAEGQPAGTTGKGTATRKPPLRLFSRDAPGVAGPESPCVVDKADGAAPVPAERSPPLFKRLFSRDAPERDDNTFKNRPSESYDLESVEEDAASANDSDPKRGPQGKSADVPIVGQTAAAANAAPDAKPPGSFYKRLFSRDAPARSDNTFNGRPSESFDPASVPEGDDEGSSAEDDGDSKGRGDQRSTSDESRKSGSSADRAVVDGAKAVGEVEKSSAARASMENAPPPPRANGKETKQASELEEAARPVAQEEVAVVKQSNDSLEAPVQGKGTAPVGKDGVSTGKDEVASTGKDGVSTGKDGVSPGKDGVTPCKDGVSTGKDGVSTGKDGVSTGKDGVSTGKDGVSTGKDGVSTGKDGVSTGKDGVTPGKDGVSTGKDGVTPGKDGVTPGKDGVSTGKDGVSTGKDGVSTGKDGVSTGKDGVSTGKDGVSTGKDGVSMGKDGVSTGKAVTPASKGEAAVSAPKSGGADEAKGKEEKNEGEEDLTFIEKVERFFTGKDDKKSDGAEAGSEGSPSEPKNRAAPAGVKDAGSADGSAEEKASEKDVVSTASADSKENPLRKFFTQMSKKEDDPSKEEPPKAEKGEKSEKSETVESRTSAEAKENPVSKFFRELSIKDDSSTKDDNSAKEKQAKAEQPKKEEPGRKADVAAEAGGNTSEKVESSTTAETKQNPVSKFFRELSIKDDSSTKDDNSAKEKQAKAEPKKEEPGRKADVAAEAGGNTSEKVESSTTAETKQNPVSKFFRELSIKDDSSTKDDNSAKEKQAKAEQPKKEEPGRKADVAAEAGGNTSEKVESSTTAETKQNPVNNFFRRLSMKTDEPSKDTQSKAEQPKKGEPDSKTDVAAEAGGKTSEKVETSTTAEIKQNPVNNFFRRLSMKTDEPSKDTQSKAEAKKVEPGSEAEKAGAQQAKEVANKTEGGAKPSESKDNAFSKFFSQITKKEDDSDKAKKTKAEVAAHNGPHSATNGNSSTSEGSPSNGSSPTIRSERAGGLDENRDKSVLGMLHRVNKRKEKRQEVFGGNGELIGNGDASSNEIISSS